MADIPPSAKSARWLAAAARIERAFEANGDEDDHGIVAMIAAAAKFLAEEIDRLEAKIEGGRAMKFVGPFDPSRTHPAGSVTQRSGSTWVALITTDEKPGDSSDWRRIGSDR